MKVYTAAEAAEFLCVPLKQVQAWIDTGRLQGFRDEQTKERLTTDYHIAKFMKNHGREDAPALRET